MMDIWLLVIVLLLLWFNQRKSKIKIITIPGKVSLKKTWETHLSTAKYYPLIYDEPSVPVTTYLIEFEGLMGDEKLKFQSYSIDLFHKFSLEEEVILILKINRKKNRVLYSFSSAIKK